MKILHQVLAIQAMKESIQTEAEKLFESIKPSIGLLFVVHWHYEDRIVFTGFRMGHSQSGNSCVFFIKFENTTTLYCSDFGEFPEERIMQIGKELSKALNCNDFKVALTV